MKEKIAAKIACGLDLSAKEEALWLLILANDTEFKQYQK
jgi:hypothetical protein